MSYILSLCLIVRFTGQSFGPPHILCSRSWPLRQVCSQNQNQPIPTLAVICPIYCISCGLLGSNYLTIIRIPFVSGSIRRIGISLLSCTLLNKVIARLVLYLVCHCELSLCMAQYNCAGCVAVGFFGWCVPYPTLEHFRRICGSNLKYFQYKYHKKLSLGPSQYS